MSSSLINNIYKLSTIQIVNYVFQIITIPYITRVLGVSSYGQITFIQLVYSFAILFVDFGLSWYATREISQQRYNKLEVSKVFISCWLFQWFLVLITIPIVYFFVNTNSNLQSERMLYFWGYGIVIGYALYPSWLFQGLEMMRESAIIHLASRLLCLPLMLFLIKTPANSSDAMIFISMPSLLAGVFAMYYLIKKNLIIWRWICLEDIKTVCTKSFSFFISKSSISLYNFIVPLSLGIISGPEALAIFSIADKVKTFAVSITSPIGQALFPRMAFYGKSQKSKIVLLALKVIKWQSIILIPIGTTIWIYSLEIVTLIAGEAFTAASMPLKWLAFVPWLSATSSILGLQVMLSINKNNLFSLINLNSLILSVIGIFIFNNSLNENLVSMLILAIESITFLLSLIYIFNIFKLEILKNNK